MQSILKHNRILKDNLNRDETMRWIKNYLKDPRNTHRRDPGRASRCGYSAPFLPRV
jgi:hypothetical protein